MEHIFSEINKIEPGVMHGGLSGASFALVTVLYNPSDSCSPYIPYSSSRIDSLILQARRMTMLRFIKDNNYTTKTSYKRFVIQAAECPEGNRLSCFMLIQAVVLERHSNEEKTSQILSSYRALVKHVVRRLGH